MSCERGVVREKRVVVGMSKTTNVVVRGAAEDSVVVASKCWESSDCVEPSQLFDVATKLEAELGGADNKILSSWLVVYRPRVVGEEMKSDE